MKYEFDRLEFEMRTEALSQAICYCGDVGGNVIDVAENFYLFLSNKRRVGSNSIQLNVNNAVYGP